MLGTRKNLALMSWLQAGCCLLVVVVFAGGCRESVARVAADEADAGGARRVRRHNAQWYIGTMSRLSPIHTQLLRRQRGDWASDYTEPQQSFADYVASHTSPVVARPATIVLQPIGPLDKDHRRIVSLTARFLAVFYDVEVTIAAPLSVRSAPRWAMRNNPSGDTQISTRWLLREVLPAKRPVGAEAVIGLTAHDLWPGKGWAYVFGQATEHRRVGVWSMYRLGEPGQGELHFQAALVRTLKVAAHELGHILGVHHCTTHRCVMNGSGSREELDRHPLTLCPEDLKDSLGDG